jgi:hypothetical protein
VDQVPDQADAAGIIPASAHRDRLSAAPPPRWLDRDPVPRRRSARHRKFRLPDEQSLGAGGRRKARNSCFVALASMITEPHLRFGDRHARFPFHDRDAHAVTPSAKPSPRDRFRDALPPPSVPSGLVRSGLEQTARGATRQARNGAVSPCARKYQGCLHPA